MLPDLIQQFRRDLKRFALMFGVCVGLMILAPFGHYFAADLEYGFLRDKREFFFESGYYLGFYAHIVGAPIAFLVGTMQVSRTLRGKWPWLHRWLGRCYCCCVLFAATPGGLVMGLRAYGGLPSVLCFTLLAVLTWISTLLGWRFGRLGNARLHARWMLRSYLLISSAIFLRLLFPLFGTIGLAHQMTYQLSVWASWLIPLCLLEVGNWRRDRHAITCAFVANHSE
jgi:uncharacterized membrane protein